MPQILFILGVGGMSPDLMVTSMMHYSYNTGQPHMAENKDLLFNNIMKLRGDTPTTNTTA